MKKRPYYGIAITSTERAHFVNAGWVQLQEVHDYAADVTVTVYRHPKPTQVPMWVPPSQVTENIMSNPPRANGRRNDNRP